VNEITLQSTLLALHRTNQRNIHKTDNFIVHTYTRGTKHFKMSSAKRDALDTTLIKLNRLS